MSDNGSRTASTTKPAIIPQDPYGTWGNLAARLSQGGHGTPNRPDMAGLPPEIANQFRDTVSVDEGGTQSHDWNLNDNPWGGFKGQDGANYVQVGDPSKIRRGGDGGVKDPSKIVYQPGAGYVTPADNLIDTGIGGVNYMMLAAALGAGALGTMAGVGAVGEGAAGAAGAGAGAAGAGEALAPLSGVTLAPETAIGTMGTYGGAAGGAAGLGGAAAGAGGGGGGLAGLGAAEGAGSAGAGLTPLTGVALEPETAIGTMGEYAGGGSPSLLQQAGSAITNNPGQAVRLGLGLAAMGGAARSSNTSGGAGTDANSIIEQMANANRVNQNTPLGSRAWTHNADGTWAVNDTMNPAEQANFENVQGMNSGVTDYAKQALARLLSAAPAQRADRSFTVNGHTIGG